MTETNTVKLSIITPVYNGENHIEACIKGVIDQHCDNVEHVIMDGGSTDRTTSIIKEYADLYEHIKWQSQRDHGQSDAMNNGILIAQGDIISFLNVDDYYEPGVFNRILALFHDKPKPTLLVGNCNVWNHDGSLSYINKPCHLKIIELLQGCDKFPHPVNPSAYFYHKALHDSIGYYNVDEHFALDVDFILRAVKVANVEYFNETWGNFRLLEGAKTVVDKQQGSDIERMKSLLKAHTKLLPVHNQLYVGLMNATNKFNQIVGIYSRKVKGKYARLLNQK